MKKLIPRSEIGKFLGINRVNHEMFKACAVIFYRPECARTIYQEFLASEVLAIKNQKDNKPLKTKEISKILGVAWGSIYLEIQRGGFTTDRSSSGILSYMKKTDVGIHLLTLKQISIRTNKPISEVRKIVKNMTPVMICGTRYDIRKIASPPE